MKYNHPIEYVVAQVASDILREGTEPNFTPALFPTIDSNSTPLQIAQILRSFFYDIYDLPDLTSTNKRVVQNYATAVAEQVIKAFGLLNEKLLTARKEISTMAESDERLNRLAALKLTEIQALLSQIADLIYDVAASTGDEDISDKLLKVFSRALELTETFSSLTSISNTISAVGNNVLKQRISALGLQVKSVYVTCSGLTTETGKLAHKHLKDALAQSNINATSSANKQMAFRTSEDEVATEQRSITYDVPVKALTNLLNTITAIPKDIDEFLQVYTSSSAVLEFLVQEIKKTLYSYYKQDITKVIAEYRLVQTDNLFSVQNREILRELVERKLNNIVYQAYFVANNKTYYVPLDPAVAGYLAATGVATASQQDRDAVTKARDRAEEMFVGTANATIRANLDKTDRLTLIKALLGDDAINKVLESDMFIKMVNKLIAAENSFVLTVPASDSNHKQYSLEDFMYLSYAVAIDNNVVSSKALSSDIDNLVTKDDYIHKVDTTVMLNGVLTLALSLMHDGFVIKRATIQYSIPANKKTGKARMLSINVLNNQSVKSYTTASRDLMPNAHTTINIHFAKPTVIKAVSALFYPARLFNILPAKAIVGKQSIVAETLDQATDAIISLCADTIMTEYASIYAAQLESFSAAARGLQYAAGMGPIVEKYIKYLTTISNRIHRK